MTHYDVFNGDADGMCALQQLRLHEPCPEARLVTGVKRDIRLLARVEQTRDSSLTVLDVSLDVNREALVHLLNQHNTITYIDHHFAGDVPQHPGLQAHLDTSATVCSSTIVDSLLQGRYRSWALVGAFGDNLHGTAQELAREAGLTAADIGYLQELGTLLNYNGYGENLADLTCNPAEIVTMMQPFVDPLEFREQSPVVARLREKYRDDLDRALALTPLFVTENVRAFALPNTAWARRVGGTYAHHLARQQPSLAHAVLQPMCDGTWRISVRAPQSRPAGADQFCRRYTTGGGRAAAAGINSLPTELLNSFLDDFRRSFSANA